MWALFVYIIIMILCFIGEAYTVGIVMLVLSVLFLLVGFLMSDVREIEVLEEKVRIRKEKNKIVEAYKTHKNELIKKYGHPTNCITIEENDLNNEVIVFEKAQRIWLAGYDLPFSAICGCRLTDSVDTEDCDIDIESSSDSGEVLGRALVGGALFGDVGAVVGAATAKRTHTVQQYPYDAWHEYKIHITINDFSTPVIILEIYDEEEIVSRILATIQIILERNQKAAQTLRTENT